MRTLCYYEKDKTGWISPGELWQALRGDEKLTILAPESAWLSDILWASDAAADELEQKWRFDAKNSLISVFWCFCAILVLFWPPLAIKMPEIVQKVLLGLFGAGILVEIASVAQIWRKKRLLATKDPKIRAAKRKPANLSPPVAFYRPGANSPPKTAKVAFFCFLALLMLNSVILAFPGRPATVFPFQGNPYVAKIPHLVVPGTQWQWQQEYYRGSIVAFLAAPEDEKTIWVIRVYYQVWHTDMLQRPGQWRSWMASRMSYFIGQISDNIWQEFPPDIEHEESVRLLVEAFQDPALQVALHDALIVHFNTHHEGVLRLQSVQLEVVEIPVSQYISAYKSQQKE